MLFENTKDLLKIHRLIWSFSGLIHPKKFRSLYWLWIIILNVSVTFFYPFHLFMGLLEVDSKSDFFKNLAILFTDIQCSIKFIIIWFNLKNIWLIEDIFTILDRRIHTRDECLHFRQIRKNCTTVLYVIGVLYASSCVTLEIAAFVGVERHLIYPAWLPFDWKTSLTNYWIAHMYQFIGVSIQIVINYANDTYPAISLAALSGHIRILSIRVSQLGTDTTKTQTDNNNELKRCIQDHKRLIEIFFVLKGVLSKGMFCQTIGTGLNICCTIIYLAFFADNVFALIYYTVLLVILPLQIFPTCYYGSVFEIEFNNVPYALFSCNWLEQDKEFKQTIIIFSQRCFRRTSFMCVRFFRINLDLFFITMRSAYSLLAVIVQAK